MELAEWGPLGNSIVFIQENNIYFKASVNQEVIQITDDGNPNIFNGICDWVYEEEVFSTKTAVWISSDNNKLAYVQFNDTPVNHINIPVYGVPGSPRDQYPSAVEFPYPKTGSNNPTVKLYLVDLKDAKSLTSLKRTEIPPPEELQFNNIISVVAWANNNQLLSVWMNRVQNDAIVQICNGKSCDTVRFRYFLAICNSKFH